VHINNTVANLVAMTWCIPAEERWLKVMSLPVVWATGSTHTEYDITHWQAFCSSQNKLTSISEIVHTVGHKKRATLFSIITPAFLVNEYSTIYLFSSLMTS